MITFCFEHIGKHFTLARGWIEGADSAEAEILAEYRYPLAPTIHGWWGRATMYELIAGRALHWLLPQWRNPIIKAWQAENPSLNLELGSFQNPYWIEREAQINLVPDYCWYIGNWSPVLVKQKLPAFDFWNERINDHSLYYYEWHGRFRPTHPIEPTWYYPMAREVIYGRATFYQLISGRALHWMPPWWRKPFIKAWKTEDPSLNLEWGSFQNPYWIPATTSFNYGYVQTLLNSVPAYSWYDWNFSVKQKLP